MSASKNFFRVANLSNLFWDNGSYKYPNTYPRLVNGHTPNKTPVMTSPTSGWVILEGDWNYCQFRKDLFFLKKSYVISHTRNKWMYVLIKDHICSLFKNKADVYATGTLITTDIENLSDNDFQYTFPVFNNYNKRILIPLDTSEFNWREHAYKPEWRITKEFDYQYPITDETFSNFVAQLEVTRDFLIGTDKKRWQDVIKDNDFLILLGRLEADKKRVAGWKNELVKEINSFIEELPARNDVHAGVVSNDVLTGSTKLNGRFAIAYSEGNPLFKTGNENYQLDIDLSGLTDIELINFDSPAPNEKYSVDHFNLFLHYDTNKVSGKYLSDDVAGSAFVHKLCKRVRLPFFNKYSSRGIYKSGGRHRTFFWNDAPIYNQFSYPQKVFIKVQGDKLLEPIDKYRSKYPAERKKQAYRSVYLYWWYDWNTYFVWGQDKNRKTIIRGETREGWRIRDTWIRGDEYFTNETTQNVLRSIAGDKRGDTFAEFPEGSSVAIEPRSFEGSHNKYFPWTRGGYSDVGEPINLGWLLGQFSMYIEGQENQFETNFPFIVKVGVTGGKKLKRLKGFKETVSSLIQLEDLYKNTKLVSKNVFTLDIFTPLSRRHREHGREEDFYIGEKLLFTSWGMAPYLLFQPCHWRNSNDPNVLIGTSIFHLGLASFFVDLNGYAYYNWTDVDDYYNPQLFGKWINYASYYYPYSLFDYGENYLKDTAKQWYKKAYDKYSPLTYKRYYQNSQNYKELKKHIVKNTGAYFETDEVDFKTNPIKELKVGDIFFSNDEWFWFDAGGAMPKDGLLHKSSPTEFWGHSDAMSLRDGSDELNNEDIVVYLNPKDKKVYIGRVNVWRDNMKLPDNQTIATEDTLDNDSSSVDYVKTSYVRISPLTQDSVSEELANGFDDLDTLIAALKRGNPLKQAQPSSLKQIRETGRSYLFNLKGTPFFCVYSREGKVSLVFKNKQQYEEVEHIDN